jgi:hypothetical protein
MGKFITSSPPAPNWFLEMARSGARISSIWSPQASDRYMRSGFQGRLQVSGAKGNPV